MWTTPKKQFSAEELARLLLIESAVPQSKICSKQPVHVCHNISFVVDLHALDDPKDIQADENGVWQRNGSPVTYVSIHGQSTGAKVFRRPNMGNHSHHYKVSRTYYRHSSSPDFRRVITTVHGEFTTNHIVVFFLHGNVVCTLPSSQSNVWSHLTE